ncbi:MAG: hypothetical protein COV91_01225 [Candidatus Taylorbacteria bacterium CG11_big_fil_rev_8_21_14_0_20_46_11]|uniref:Serine/threonine protein kinase n=1 Tax=Candidatus Taylorbacteria bacterium CG11_big_fil_rev_8_21_14_0_20_46_11 TaxID=1975025 RepID=A0A2H0KCK3_9BACT|nr:MAG: hypothetical protein COV91_01225 [Candidatus Taylorbacteria bacterium CG11_big_fil_rev_8_21_14_0_20_46_11]
MTGDVAKQMERKLRGYFESHIFARGKDYFQSGAVDTLAVLKQKDATIQVKATVYGSEEYETSLTFDPKGSSFSDFECTCPYDDLCKHAVALGLAFIEQHEGTAYIKKSVVVRDAEVVEKEAIPAEELLTALNGSANSEAIDALIRKLLALKEKTNREGEASQKLAVTLPAKPALLLSKYFLEFSEWNGRLSLHRKDDPYQLASVKRILEHSDTLTPGQKEFFAYLKTEQSAQGYGALRQDIDFAKLFRLVAESGLDVYSGYTYGRGSPLVIDLSPPKCKAAIWLQEDYNEYTKHTRRSFVFELLGRQENENGESREYTAGKDSLFSFRGNTISVYTMPTTLAVLMARARSRTTYDYKTGRSTKSRTLADLTLEETVGINSLLKEAPKHFDFTTDLVSEYVVQHFTESKKVLLVDFSFDEETLSIRPALDYGCFVQNVTESVYVARQQWNLLIKHRGGFEHPGEHILIIEGKNIHHASIDKKTELALFKQFYEQDIGLNKGGTRTLQGLGKIAEFYDTHFAKLREHCAKALCELRFTRDALSFEQDTFRADVSIDAKADTDWLAFDAAFYCGPDRLSLGDLSRFLKEGHAFWRRQDGRLSRITNREELERFVGMLESFEERENGQFAGRLYHAPELEYVMTSSPHYTATRGKGFARFLKEIKAGKPVKQVRLSKKHEAFLRPYQKEGVEWLYFLRSYHFAGVLADDMGLGKTIQTLVLLEKERIQGKPSLVVCPKTLLYNWQIEASRFAPTLAVAVVDGTPNERETLIANATAYDLLITGYATLKKDDEAYKKAGLAFNYCVLDEAQFIKNHATKSAQVVKEVDADHRLALTGTPLENSVSEIWSVFDFLMPGFLGSYKTFSERFHKPIMERGDVKALELLRKKVECFMLRRTKGEVLKELPPKVEQTSHCRLSEAQSLLYQEVLSRVKSDMYEAVKERGFEKSRIHIFAGLMKLRQVCNHPALLLKGKSYRKYESTKLDMFNELVEEVCENKRKVLVFSQFTGMLDILSEELRSKNIPHLYLSGKTEKRQKLVEKFNTDPSIPVFLISLKAGGTGLNLTAADTVIIFDPWWNPSVENQAIDRAHRIGQKQSVNVYRLITTGTIEEKIVALQQKKKKLFDALIGESKDLFKKLTWEDVQELFR